MTDSARPAPRVDSHAHAYTTDMPLAGTAWHRPPHDATVEQYLAELDAHGISYGVLAAASLHGDYDDYQRDCVRRHPRLRATVLARPGLTREAMEQMDREGIVGVRIQWRNVPNPPDLGAPDWQALLRRVADLGWHVQLHDDAARLPGPLAHLHAAGVNVVVDHFGRPDTALGLADPGFEAVLRAVENGRTWVKLASAFRLTDPSAAGLYADALLRHAGPGRLFWGSDWPFAAFESRVSYAQTLDDYARWVPDAAVRRRIDETAYAFYFDDRKTA